MTFWLQKKVLMLLLSIAIKLIQLNPTLLMLVLEEGSITHLTGADPDIGHSSDKSILRDEGHIFSVRCPIEKHVFVMCHSLLIEK